MEGRFEEEALRQLEVLIVYAYSCKTIRTETYHDLLAWLAEERKSMDEDVCCKDIFEKTFYAIAYQTESGWKHVINARRGYIYQKKHTLQQQGIFVSPIYSDTYYYNYTLRLPQVHKRFEQEAQAYLNPHYLQTLEKIFGTMTG